MRTLSSSSPLILRRIFRPPTATTHSPPPPPLFHPFTFKHPLSVSLPTPSLSFSSPSDRRHFTSSRSFSVLTSEAQTPIRVEEEDDEIGNEVGIESGSDEDFVEPVKVEKLVDSKISNAHKELLLKLQSMSVKEKKELGSYAHSLGKKLKSQQVGKSGVTGAVATALVETLESNELLKLKIHNNCPGELDDVVKQLEEATGSVVVGRIGRTVIIYRPSLTKLISEEKKKQAKKIFLKRRAAFKSSFQMQNRGQSSTLSGRGRRGIGRS